MTTANMSERTVAVLRLAAQYDKVTNRRGFPNQVHTSFTRSLVKAGLLSWVREEGYTNAVLTEAGRAALEGK